MTGQKRELRHNIIRVLVFALLLLIMLACSCRFFFVDTASSKTFIDSFYAEREDSLDVIYLGNSGVYRFYQSPLAWEEYGFTGMSLATASQPAAAIRYMMEECLKTQSPRLFVVDLRTFSDSGLSEANMHNLFNFIRPSWTKLKMMLACLRYGNFWFADIPEFIFPIFRFHERWEELTAEDLQPLVSEYKGAYDYSAFLHNTQNKVTEIVTTEERNTPQKNSQWALSSLLDYCDSLDIPVLFVAAPLLEHEKQKQTLNALGDMVTARGYDFINFNTPELLQAAGLEVDTDFMDNTHTNLRGSILFTHYLAGVLAQKYQLPDHRADPAYADWDEAYAAYCAVMGESSTEFHRSLLGQAVTLPAALSRVESNE